MHKQILTKEQIQLLPLIRLFSDRFYLVGGTAIALHLGHRRSLDFDLFTEKNIKRINIKSVLKKNNFDYTIIHEATEQFHVIIHGIKITFFNYPYPIDHPHVFCQTISLPCMLDLAAMNAFALGGRAKWKDYVDLYFILKDHFSITEIVARSHQVYHDHFNEKLFRQQLSYFDDIDYSEPVTYLYEPVPEDEIKNFLIQQATEPF